MRSPYPIAEHDPEHRFDPFPLTDQQQAYLLGRTGAFELGNVSTHAYYEYEGELDTDRFTLAWRRAIERHDALRTVILPDTGEQAVLADTGEFTPEIVDLRGRDPEPELRRVRERLSHQVRPADAWPLFSVVVSLLDEGRSRVHVSFDALILDYLSWQLLIADLTRFYRDPDAELAPLPVTYRDYVLAEAAITGTDRYRRAEEYWRGKVAALPPAPRLPLAADPATVDVPRWSSRLATLPDERWRAVKASAAAHGLTASTVCLTAFAEVLAAWSESAHFTLNVPRMNRFPLHPEANALLGEFASFSLLEVDHRDPDLPFAERAKRLQRTFWTDLQHQEYPGVRALRDVARATGGGRRALMPVVLTSTIGFTAGEEPLLGHTLRRVFAVTQTPQVYLDTQIEESPAGLVYNLDSVDALLPPETADALCADLGRILDRLAEPDAWNAPDLLGEAGGSGVAGGLRGPVAPIPDDLVHDAFVRQARAHPDRTAVIAPDRTLTYGELHGLAARVAVWLRAQGARPGDPVAVLLDKGWEQVVAAYGVLLAGCPYLPLDAAAPTARVHALLDHAGTETVLDAETLAKALTLPEQEPPPMTAGPGDLAYVLFTSGSTGRPKGVMVEHRGMVNALEATRAEFGVGPDDTCLAVTALHHDMSAFDLFGVLGAGGTVVVPAADRARDADHWAELAAEHGVTLWNSVPAMMEMLLAAGSAPHSLRTVFLGGDWVPPRLAADLLDQVPGIDVVSVGGPTETTLWNIWHRVVPADLDRATIPYGRPIANTAYHVLDERGRERPRGVVGELCCAGPGVARGYWDDPERTGAAFTDRRGERIYRTGDLGRVLPDGTIEFVGRADAQVKVRGMRIEPGEVEAALREQPGVTAAAVVGVPRADGRGHRAIAAHVTGDADPDALRAALAERLPDHLVPATVTVLEELPLTGNGKVDRAALAARSQAASSTEEREIAAPRTPLEETIAQIWAEVVGLDAVGVHDDFFTVGGDSVAATRVLVELREALDRPGLPLMALLSTGTVAGMATALLAEDPSLDRVAELYQHVLALSDDEVEAGLSG
ncbi:non-ribosomal peptide synthetase [Nocardiopsis aegyptia]|uniref:Phenyloxazoline synthase MbtB n=1 Tax=Nocardiopsis aegyptia TaxID=220378 RepID=A0A7Z0EPG1_9ACTN|nr:non-ribosomal peptide synthetase [Nocardiopsis aegyptia]NYJ35870.1 amino acid adenylation domain-containing protein [Nocardiopsis aegyptia]